MLSKVDIVNQALLRCGHYNQIERLGWDNPATPEEMLAARFYDDTRRECLTMGPWNFAETEVQLTGISEWPLGSKWPHAFAYPADCLMARELTPGGMLKVDQPCEGIYIEGELPVHPGDPDSPDFGDDDPRNPIPPPTVCPFTIQGPTTVELGGITARYEQQPQSSTNFIEWDWRVTGAAHEITWKRNHIIVIKPLAVGNITITLVATTDAGCKTSSVINLNVTAPPKPGDPIPATCPCSITGPNKVLGIFESRRHTRGRYYAVTPGLIVASWKWSHSGAAVDRTGQRDGELILTYLATGIVTVNLDIVTTSGCKSRHSMTTQVLDEALALSLSPSSRLPVGGRVAPNQATPHTTEIPGYVRQDYHDRRYETLHPENRKKFIVGNFLRANRQNVKVIKARVPAAFLTYTRDIDIPNRYTPSFASMFSWKLAMAFGLALGLQEKQMNTIMQGFMGDQSAALATNANERDDDYEEDEVDWLEGRI